METLPRDCAERLKQSILVTVEGHGSMSCRKEYLASAKGIGLLGRRGAKVNSNVNGADMRLGRG